MRVFWSIPININDLRTMGKINQNENHSIFDADIPRHLEGLQNIANAPTLAGSCRILQIPAECCKILPESTTTLHILAKFHKILPLQQSCKGPCRFLQQSRRTANICKPLHNFANMCRICKSLQNSANLCKVLQDPARICHNFAVFC